MSFIKKCPIACGRIVEVIRGMDRGLMVALCLVAAFGLQGIQWGRVECWNPDEVALRSLKKKPLFEPDTFTKPPFHTYVTHILVSGPIQGLEGLEKFRRKFLEHPPDLRPVGNEFNELILLGARLLTLGMLAGTVCLVFAIVRDAAGLFAARCIALLMATSAGFFEASHFLTADAPMLFWMVLAFYFCQRLMKTGAMSDYLWAGAVTGLATATKYNALAVGIAIPVAHLLRSKTVREAFFDRRVIFGVLMVPAGFLIGCPYALLNHRKFVQDFMYNYTVTPHYGGQMAGNGYLNFLGRIPQIIGWPGAVFVGLAILVSIFACVFRKASADAIKTFVVSAAVVVLYYVKIGAFPRLETRFVLPVAPFLLMMCAPYLGACRTRWLTTTLLAPVLIYNCVCSYYVGIRFSDDPRMAAITWVQSHLPAGTSIESTGYCPHWDKMPGIDLNAWTTPTAKARGAMFQKIFGDNPWVMDELTEKEGHVDPANFTLAALQARNPEYVALDSLSYLGALNGPVKQYFFDLLAGRFPYEIVFDMTNPPVPGWIYPSSIDFLENRIILLHRAGEPPPQRTQGTQNFQSAAAPATPAVH